LAALQSLTEHPAGLHTWKTVFVLYLFTQQCVVKHLKDDPHKWDAPELNLTCNRKGSEYFLLFVF